MLAIPSRYLPPLWPRIDAPKTLDPKPEPSPLALQVDSSEDGADMTVLTKDYRMLVFIFVFFGQLLLLLRMAETHTADCSKWNTNHRDIISDINRRRVVDARVHLFRGITQHDERNWARLPGAEELHDKVLTSLPKVRFGRPDVFGGIGVGRETVLLKQPPRRNHRWRRNKVLSGPRRPGAG